MLTFLRIRNIALIDDLAIEFGAGLNLLTGETGSGKSIIVDSLGALTGERVSTDLIKDGCPSAMIEGSFTVTPDKTLRDILDESGIDVDNSQIELLVRREIALAGKSRVFINDRGVTQTYLRRVGEFLVDIHGQGEQASLYNVAGHVEMLDDFAHSGGLNDKVGQAFAALSECRARLRSLERDESEKLQLLDILRFQVAEIDAAALVVGEDTDLNDEKRRLNNVEKLTSLAREAFGLLYENEESTLSTLERAQKRVTELGDFDPRFADYLEGVASSRAVLDDLSIALRNFLSHLEFSPERLDEIENRLAEITRLKRKYGESIEAVLGHLTLSRERLETIETAEVTKQELETKAAKLRLAYLQAATELHEKRVAAGGKLEKQVIQNLTAVAMEKAKFEVRITASEDEADFTPNGYDRVEFYFSANPGEPPKPLARVASGGEASRLMLVLKTTAAAAGPQKTAVFDEIDVGIGGRVAESVGRKLKKLAANQQVLCVTHQPQIASLADRHFIVEKTVTAGRTRLSARELTGAEQIEEIARMLAGETITEAARENARAMLAAA
ncbi:MAG TPA: DNA repair protein RecN [Pyrinomonadaceae bacterium]|nr:DNA repair protein RecN [Pyrinomonadaceae bacterium]